MPASNVSLSNIGIAPMAAANPATVAPGRASPQGSGAETSFGQWLQQAQAPSDSGGGSGESLPDEGKTLPTDRQPQSRQPADEGTDFHGRVDTQAHAADRGDTESEVRTKAGWGKEGVAGGEGVAESTQVPDDEPVNARTTAPVEGDVSAETMLPEQSMKILPDADGGAERGEGERAGADTLARGSGAESGVEVEAGEVEMAEPEQPADDSATGGGEVEARAGAVAGQRIDAGAEIDVPDERGAGPRVDTGVADGGSPESAVDLVVTEEQASEPAMSMETSEGASSRPDVDSEVGSGTGEGAGAPGVGTEASSEQVSDLTGIGATTEVDDANVIPVSVVTDERSSGGETGVSRSQVRSSGVRADAGVVYADNAETHGAEALGVETHGAEAPSIENPDAGRTEVHYAPTESEAARDPELEGGVEVVDADDTHSGADSEVTHVRSTDVEISAESVAVAVESSEESGGEEGLESVSRRASPELPEQAARPDVRDVAHQNRGQPDAESTDTDGEHGRRVSEDTRDPKPASIPASERIDSRQTPIAGDETVIAESVPASSVEAQESDDRKMADKPAVSAAADNSDDSVEGSIRAVERGGADRVGGADGARPAAESADTDGEHGRRVPENARDPKSASIPASERIDSRPTPIVAGDEAVIAESVPASSVEAQESDDQEMADRPALSTTVNTSDESHTPREVDPPIMNDSAENTLQTVESGGGERVDVSAAAAVPVSGHNVDIPDQPQGSRDAQVKAGNGSATGVAQPAGVLGPSGQSAAGDGQQAGGQHSGGQNAGRNQEGQQFSDLSGALSGNRSNAGSEGDQQSVTGRQAAVTGAESRSVADTGAASNGSAQQAPNTPKTDIMSSAAMQRLQDPAWSRAMGQRAIMMAQYGPRTAEIQLDPPELGAMQIRIHLGANDQVSVSFSSPHAAVRDAIDQQMPRLREMFAEQGLELSQSSVSDQSADGRRDGSSQARGRGGSGDYGDQESGVETPVSPSSVPVGLVDYYA